MQLSLQICIFVTALIYCTDTAPRRSWGSFAQLLENNSTVELCTNGQCVHWAECRVLAGASNRSKACSNKSGGPWVCCMDLTGEALERSKTKEKTIFTINNLEKLNTPTKDYSTTKSGITNQERNEQNSSSASIVDKPEENLVQLDETYGSIFQHAHNILTQTNMSSKTEGTQNEIVIVPLDRNGVHLPMKPFLTGESEQTIEIENPNVDRNGGFIPKNSTLILKSPQNETAIVPMIENGEDLPNNVTPIIKSLQNETAVVDNIYGLDSSSIVADDETSKASDLPVAERIVNSPMRPEWMEVQGIMNRNYPNSNYYSRRRTWKTSPPPRRKSTWSYWNEDYDLNSQWGSTTYRNAKTTSRSLGRPTKKTWPTVLPTNFGRKSTLSRRVTEDSWENGPTSSAKKTTKGWGNPTPGSRNKPFTVASSSVQYRTTLSLRKPTTKSPHLDKRSTTIRKTMTTARSLVNRARQPDHRDASSSVDKIMNSGEHRTTHHSWSKPASWSRNTTAPSWSISTGMWSGRRIPNASTSKVTTPVLKPTTASPRRTMTSRSPVTKSTISHRRTSTMRQTESIPVTGINIPMCGVRQDAVTSRRGRDVTTEHHPDSVSIYPNSRNNTRESFQRIVGGTEAEPFTWPWVAALYKVTSSGGNRFLSAGSLINENFVLTAAHVFTPEDLRSASFVVMLGTHTAKEAVAEYPVMSVLRHPQYQQRFYYNDIALLRLVKPVVFNNYVMPVCLPSYLMTDDDLVGTRVTVMGWGDESYGGITSRVLKEATLPIVSRQTCNASYIRVASNRFPKGITTNMLCAGAPDGGKDACQGDSGGPLTTTRNGRHILLGIVSFGYRCGDKEYPGVYTRVASYLNWIAEKSHHDRNHDYDDDYHARGR